MSDQPPQSPGEFDKYFRDPPPGAGPAPSTDELAGYDKFFRRDSPRPPSGPGKAAAPAVLPPPSQSPPTRLPSPRRKRPLWRRILRWLFILLAILLIYVLALLTYFIANVQKIDAMPDNQIGNTPGAVTLLVGTDERPDDPAAGSRTDTIMLLVDPLWGPPSLVSLPRDSWVEIPGHDDGKINSAFSIGGPQLLIETVELNTGLHVDHYAEVGFSGIVELTDAVGGVELCIDYDVNDPNSGLVMEAGCSVLDGQQALAFCRMRYSDPKGDLGRIERQQQWIESFIKTVLQPQNFFNPATMMDVMKAAADAITVDEHTGAFNMARLGWGMVQLGRGNGQTTTVPVADNSYNVDGQSAVLWDEAAADELFASLGAG